MTQSCRYALNIKGVAHKTVWLDYSEVNDKIRSLGAEPTTVTPDGTPYYTVPTIYDPATQRTVTDSWTILAYLDEQYPQHLLFPPSTRVLQRAFADLASLPLVKAFFPALLQDMVKTLTLTGAVAFRAARERQFGAPLEVIAATGGRREALLKEFLEKLEELGKFFQANRKEDVFIGGDKPIGVDCDLAAWLTTVERTVGKEDKLWKDVLVVDGGRYEGFMKAFEKWQTVV